MTRSYKHDPKDRIQKKTVKRGSTIKLFRKYYKHGQPGSAITKDHEVVDNGGLLMTVYAMESAWVEHLDKTFRSRILRCKMEDGADMVVIPRIDVFRVVADPPAPENTE